MAELYLRRRAVGQGTAIALPREHFERMHASAPAKDSKVALRGSLPRRGAAARVGALAHRLSPDIVAEQCRDFRADGLGIAKWHQYAAAVRQQLSRVPVGGRNDRFPQAKAVSQGPGRHLRFVEIWRDVDVTHRDEVEQCCLIDEPVEKNDVPFDAEGARASYQALAVGLAFTPNEVWMRCAQND